MRNSENSATVRSTVLAVAVGAMIALGGIMLTVAMLAVSPRQAAATPQFAQQTKLPCGQCHANPAGGGKLKGFGQKFKDKGNKL